MDLTSNQVKSALMQLDYLNKIEIPCEPEWDQLLGINYWTGKNRIEKISQSRGIKFLLIAKFCYLSAVREKDPQIKKEHLSSSIEAYNRAFDYIEDEEVSFLLDDASPVSFENNNGEITHNEPTISSKESNKALKKQSKTKERIQLSNEELASYALKSTKDNEVLSDKEAELNIEKEQIKKQQAAVRRSLDELEKVNDPGKCPDIADMISSAASITGFIAVGAVIAMFIFHCIIWFIGLFTEIDWETWEWTKNTFWIGLISVVIITLGTYIYGKIKVSEWERQKSMYDYYVSENERFSNMLLQYNKELGKINNEFSKINYIRREVLLYQFHNELFFPIRKLDDWKYENARETFFELREIKEQIKKSSSPKEILEASIMLANKKLLLFEEHSIKQESTSTNALQLFTVALKEKENITLRGDAVPECLSSDRIELLMKLNENFSENDLDLYLDEFNQILQMDTSGTFTKHDSALLEKQANRLEGIYNMVNNHLNRYGKIISQLNELLAICRLIAYRNIYLGVELINIIRDNAGGGSLEVADDVIKIEQNNNYQNLVLNIPSFDIASASGVLLCSAINSLKDFFDAFELEDLIDEIKENPKTVLWAAGIKGAFEVIATGIQLWSDRNAKIRALLEKEEVMMKNLQNNVDQYLKLLPASLRLHEMILAILEFNKGFFSIYSELQRKVFIEKDIDSISTSEIHQLCIAMKEYRNIANSKI